MKKEKETKKKQSGFVTFEYPSINLVGSENSIESLGYNAVEITRIEETLLPDDEYIDDIYIRIKKIDKYPDGYDNEEDVSYIDF